MFHKNITLKACLKKILYFFPRSGWYFDFFLRQILSPLQQIMFSINLMKISKIIALVKALIFAFAIFLPIKFVDGRVHPLKNNLFLLWIKNIKCKFWSDKFKIMSAQHYGKNFRTEKLFKMFLNIEIQFVFLTFNWKATSIK